MKLYEFELKENSIAVTEYEVEETKKLYIVQKTESNGRNIGYRYLTRVPKEIVDSGKVLADYGTYYLSLTNDMSVARDMFILHLDKSVIPSCKEKIQKATKEKEKYEDMLNRLIAKRESE